MKNVKIQRVVDVEITVFEKVDLIKSLREYFDCFLDGLVTSGKEKLDVEFIRRSIYDSILQFSFIDLCRQCFIRELLSLDTFVLYEDCPIMVNHLIKKDSI